jgi:RNA polymerase sigma-70 factor (ECF subfamily)
MSASFASTSPSLLDRVQRHDAAGWQRFVDLYSPLVYWWCRQSGLAADDAADVVQESFRSVLVGIGGFRPQAPGAFRGWLRAIVTNKIRDHFRRLGDKPQAVGGTEAHLEILAIPVGDAPSAGSHSDECASNSLVHRAAEMVRAEFEPHTWQAFWLTAAEGLTAVAAGRQLDMHPNAIRQAKYKVLHRLRKELDGLEAF